MTYQLTPERASLMLFDADVPILARLRSEQLGMTAASMPITDKSIHRSLIAMSICLELGSSPELTLTGHKYLDVALALERSGYHREASVVANLPVSRYLALFMGENARLAGFRPVAEDSQISQWLAQLDAMVLEESTITTSIQCKIASVALRYGADSPYVAAWTLLAHEEEIQTAAKLLL